MCSSQIMKDYPGTRLVRDAYSFDVSNQIGEGTYGQVFIGNSKTNPPVKVRRGLAGAANSMQGAHGARGRVS